MDFGFSAEQREVQALAQKIFADKVSPESLAAYDEFRQPRFDRNLWGTLAEAGLLGAALDEAHGGMGFGFTELALLIEEAGRHIAPLPLIPCLVSAALPLQRFAPAALREEWLPKIANGSAVLTAALAEPGPAIHSSPAAPALCAAKKVKGGYQVSGVKTCVPFAREAERILFAAKVAGEGDEGGAVLLLADPAADGVALEDVRYTTFEPQCELRFDNARVDDAAVVAGPGAGPEQGATAMRWTAERTAAAVCAHQLGVCDRAMRMTASYTAERQQFGVPIATFQAVGHRAANCFIDVECLKLSAYQAVSRLAGEQDAATEVQVAKIWAGDAGHRVSYAAQHLHGGTGIDRDYPLWRYCLWARHNELILGGTAQQLAELGRRIAAGEAYCG